MPTARGHLILLLALAIQQGSTSEHPTHVTPMNVVGWTGGAVILPCAPQKKDLAYSSYSYPCWYYEQQPVQLCGSQSKFSGRMTTSMSHNLHISNLQKSDSGLYVYTSNDRKVWKVNLTVTDDSTTSAGDLQFIVGVKGRSVVLPCFASYPGKSFSKYGCWYHDDMDIYCWSSSASSTKFTPRLRGMDNYNINLTDLAMSDAGTFTCQRSSSERGQVKLIVRGVGVSTPVITRSPNQESVNYGTAVTLTCLSEEGSWPITYRWFRLDPATGNYISVGDPQNTLSFPSVQVEDSGEYRCVASNGAEGKTWSQSTTIRLAVHRPIADISISLTPKQLFVFEGQPLVLRCQVGAGSEPIFWTWFWIPDGPKAGNETVVGGEQELRLAKARQSGQYACSAQNQYDGRNITLRSSNVTVHIVPNPEPHPVTWAALGGSGLVLLALVFLWWNMRSLASAQTGQNYSLEKVTPVTKGDIELKTLPDSCQPQSKRKVLNNANVYEDNRDEFYCPLSGQEGGSEDVYDDLN